MEKNVFGFDTLVGTGIIDLENRWFSKKWRALQVGLYTSNPKL